MKRLFMIGFALIAAVLTGCAQLGLEKPQSPEDGLQYGKSQVSAAYKTIGDLKASQSITVDEGVALFKRVEAVEKDLATAEPLLTGPQASTGQAKVALALKALVLIQADLRARQGKKVAHAPLQLQGD